MILLKKIERALNSEEVNDIALLALRLIAGGCLALNHGFNKFSNFAAMSEKFPDPLHIGSSTVSLALAVGGEFFACILVVVGLFTRLSAVPALITMLVAGLIHHQADGLSDREPALLFAVCFLMIIVRGPGRISLDAFFKRL